MILHGFAVLPVFALASAGVVISNAGGAFSLPLTLSVPLGLLIGETVGVSLLS